MTSSAPLTRPFRGTFRLPALSAFLWLVLGAAAHCLAAEAASDAITGTWVVAEKDAHIEIYKEDTGYFGRISWLREGGEEKSGPHQDSKMHESPRIGLIIVRGFRFDGREWRGGTLYDPTDGKSYRGIIRLDNKGRLHVRGFIGISLFGRTTVWERMP